MSSRGVGESLATYMTLIASLLLLFFISESDCIKIVEMQVPQSVLAGDTVHLQCEFDLERDSLYSLTWWREQRQFYQYSPTSGTGKAKSKYDTRGIQVDEARSSVNTVVLRNVSLDTAGKYKCEVVAEFPTYEKDSKAKDMTVIDIPDRVPVIQVGKTHYNQGELLVANCTSTESRPAPVINWEINGLRLPKASSRIVSEEVTNSRLISTTSELRLHVSQEHFRDFQLRLTCMAEISPLYEQSTDVMLTGPGFKTAGPTQKYYINQGPRFEITVYQWLITCFTITYVSVMDFRQ